MKKYRFMCFFAVMCIGLVLIAGCREQEAEEAKEPAKNRQRTGMKNSGRINNYEKGHLFTAGKLYAFLYG